MREIKFRAWHPEWDEMVLSDSNKSEPFWDKREFYPFGFMVGFSQYPADDRWIIMQFTGLRDVNGREIYDADIIQWESGHKSVVSWSEASGAWVTDGKYLGYCLVTSPGTVIGNTYQHPRPLRGGTANE